MSNLSDYFISGPQTLQLLGSATVVGSAATTMTVGGLDFSAYAAFKLYVSFDNALASTRTIKMTYNSDTTDANYNSQLLTIDGATVGAAATTDATIAQMHSNAVMTLVIDILRDATGQPRATGYGNEDAGNVEIRNVSHRWNDATNITAITFTSDTASGFDVGSYVKVYGIVA